MPIIANGKYYLIKANGKYYDIVNPFKTYTLTIVPTPADATVTLTAQGYSQEGNSITVQRGTAVSWSVEADGYKTQIGTYTVLEDKTLNVTLVSALVNYIFRDLDSNGVLSLATGQLEDASAIESIDTDYLFYNSFYNCPGLTGEANFPSLTTISGNYGCSYMFGSCTNLTSVSFPSLTMISGRYGCRYMFDGCRNLTSVSFPSLTTISGVDGCEGMFVILNGKKQFPDFTGVKEIAQHGCYYMFSGCTNLTSVSFPSLTTIGSYGCGYMFRGCTNIESISFPALTTSSFGSDTTPFYYMLDSTGTSVTHTLHFPSNLQSTISGLTSYPNFGGTSGYVVCAFDLPATN